MKSEQRLDATLDRTAKEAVSELSRELSGPIAVHVGRELRGHIDPHIRTLTADAAALALRTKEVGEVVTNLEDGLVRRLRASLAEASAEATERMINGASAGIAARLGNSVESIGDAALRAATGAENSLVVLAAQAEQLSQVTATAHELRQDVLRRFEVSDSSVAALRGTMLEAVTAHEAAVRNLDDSVRSIGEVGLRAATSAEDSVVRLAAQSEQLNQLAATGEDAKRQVFGRFDASDSTIAALRSTVLEVATTQEAAVQKLHARIDELTTGTTAALEAISAHLAELRAEANAHRKLTEDTVLRTERLQDALHEQRAQQAAAELQAVTRQNGAAVTVRELLKAAEVAQARRTQFLAGLLALLIGLNLIWLWKALVSS